MQIEHNKTSSTFGHIKMMVKNMKTMCKYHPSNTYQVEHRDTASVELRQRAQCQHNTDSRGSHEEDDLWGIVSTYEPYCRLRNDYWRMETGQMKHHGLSA